MSGLNHSNTRKHAAVFTLAITSIVYVGLFQNCSEAHFDTTPNVKIEQQEALSSTSSITINDGAKYTNQALVNLTLISPRAMKMKISNQSDCSDGSWEDYSASKAWTLSQLDATVSVYAQYRDIANNISPCVNAAIIHDDVPPTATFSSPVGVVTNAATMSVAWSSQDNLSGVDHVACVDASGAPAACDSQLQVKPSAEGSNAVKVRVYDKAGNVSKDYVYAWLYDKTPPTVVINSQPASLTGSTSAQISFSVSDAMSGVAKILCHLDGAAFQLCTSPMSYTGLAAGVHKFEVYAADNAGNIAPFVSASWTIDLTAPTIQFTQTPPAASNSAQGTFNFTGSKNGQPISSFQCSLDSATFATCTPPVTLTGLKEGSHSFSIRGLDSLGNISQPLTYTWLVDLTLPSLAFVSGPSGLVNSSLANFQWNASDAGSGLKLVECQLDGAAYAACPGGAMSYPSLPEGAHTFSVRATDNAGNVASISRTWTIDLTAPVVTISSAPSAFVKSVNAQFAFTATDANGIQGYQCKVDNGNYAACSSPDSIANLSEGGHVFYVEAIDNAGNVSAPASAQWTIDLSPPIINIISAPSTLQQGQHAVIQYQVIDAASGVASVSCGITSPSGSVAACNASASVDLGTPAVGTYTFTISATDNVGNSFSSPVSFQVTAAPIVCDPFSSTQDATCSGGIIGDIYYLDSSGQTAFKNLSTKTVDYFFSSGIKANAILDLSQLFVPTRSFTSGFPASGTGALVQDNSGQALTSYFAFHLHTVMKLDPLKDTAGWYQFATLSDDGSMVNITPTVGGASQTLIGNDGDHPTKMGCSGTAIYFDDTTRLPTEIKYYQGPPTEIALTLMWKKVSSQNSPMDSHCGDTGSTLFFGSSYTDMTGAEYGTLINSGWRVMGAGNFLAPPTN